MKTYRGYIAGLKWSGIMEFLFELSNSLKLELKVLQDDKGVVRRTIYFEISGEDEAINEFHTVCEATVKIHNGEAAAAEPQTKEDLAFEKKGEDLFKALKELTKRHPSPEPTGSDFGKGFVYCLGLFAAHFENDSAQLIKNLRFLIEKSDEERQLIFTKADEKHNYGKDMDMAIHYMQHVLPIYHTEEKLLSQQIETWANGSSDHLYEIKVPPQWKKTAIATKTKVLQDMGLQMGHGFTGRIWT
jgi:hypothetical protein